MNLRIFGFQRRVWWPKWVPASSRSCRVGIATKVSLLDWFVCRPAVTWCRNPEGHRRPPSGGLRLPGPAWPRGVLPARRSARYFRFLRSGRGLKETSPCRRCRNPTAQPVASTLRELEPLACSGAARLLALDHARVAGEQAGSAQLGAVLLVGLAQRASDRVPHRTGLAGHAAAAHVRLDIEGAERVGRGERLLDVLHQRRAREVVTQGAAVDIPLPGAGNQVDPGDAGLAAANGLPAKLFSAAHQSTL